MSDAANLTRFRCPQCRSRFMIDVAAETIPYLCPTCHVELEPHGKAVSPSAITTEITPAMRESLPPPKAAPSSVPGPAVTTSEVSDVEYLRKIYFWVRLIAAIAAAGLILEAVALFK